MRTVPLGRTDVEVTRLGLGLASLGGMFAPVPSPVAAATIDRAWHLGVRLFDTAPVYGYGLSETRAGAALGPRPRDEFVLCTKVGRIIEPGGPDTQEIWADPPPGVGPRLDYSRAGVVRSVEDSLERLGLDRVDILHIHDPDLDYPAAVTEAYAALADLRAAGVVRAVSLGVNHADVAARFLREAPPPGPDCVLLAGRYSLLDRSGLDDLLPLCLQRNVAVMAAGVFQGGVFASVASGAAASEAFAAGTSAASATSRSATASGGAAGSTVSAATLHKINTIREICARYGVPPLAAAVQFPFTHPAVACVVVGARAPHEVAESVALLDHPVPEELWAELSATVGGSSGR